MHAVVVGAGAVGQVLAYYLVKGGADVTFYVRDKYVEDLQAHPLTLHRLDGGSAARRVDFREYNVISSFDQLRAVPADVVILTVSSDALRADGFVRSIVEAAPQATLVVTTAGVEDRTFLCNTCRVPQDQLVTLGIAFIAWQAPLPHERFEPVPPSQTPNKAIGYVLPLTNPISGPSARVAPLSTVFNRGGLKVGAVEAVHLDLGPTSSIFAAILLGLEACDWKFNTLAASPLLRVATNAAAQAVTIALNYLRETERISLWRRIKWGALEFFMHYLFGPRIIRFLTWAAPRYFPFDIEAYLEYHFTKVIRQTHLYVDGLMRLARQRGLDFDHLRALVDALERQDQ